MKSPRVTSPLTSMLADSPPQTAQSGFCSSSNVKVYSESSPVYIM